MIHIDARILSSCNFPQLFQGSWLWAGNQKSRTVFLEVCSRDLQLVKNAHSWTWSQTYWTRNSGEGPIICVILDRIKGNPHGKVKHSGLVGAKNGRGHRNPERVTATGECQWAGLGLGCGCDQPLPIHTFPKPIFLLPPLSCWFLIVVRVFFSTPISALLQFSDTNRVSTNSIPLSSNTNY